MKSQQVAPFLPREIIVDILKLLPVKTLIRFQCVSKHWKNIIKSPSFITDHLHHSSQHRPCLLFHEFLNYDCLELYLLNFKMQVVEVQNIPLVEGGLWIVGSSNGLLCIRIDKYAKPISPPVLFLWNPAFRDVRPVFPTFPDFDGDCQIGFGYSPIVNDYKIVGLYLSKYDYQVQVVEVYSLSKGSWRNIEVFDLGGLTITGSAGFTVNGAIFWIGYKRDIGGGCEYATVSFDIANEEFSLMPVPDVDRDLTFGANFTEFEQRLAILFPTKIENPESCLIELWMLEECTCRSGERWSWVKKYVFSPAYLHPITIWRNEIVGICHRLPGEEGPEIVERIVLSNITSTELKVLFDRVYVAFNYVESLVPVRNIHIEES
ncbi:hypothetical protein QN277_006178 [Acacia crassicarpa]|uniref:F-box domain-containing protein n=1 Tax=Acacia crassicarpa TaxID=499986 RepID=A0AAE1IXS4_9FABA|nr:hypothetical protein QN277_006178 [Acacia crassicarpa]